MFGSEPLTTPGTNRARTNSGSLEVKIKFGMHVTSDWGNYYCISVNNAEIK